MAHGLIGRSVERLEDPPLLCGAARFVDDIVLPGLAHIAFVRSPHAHALIKSLNCEAARAAPGVVAVLTLADLAPRVTDQLLRVALPSPAFRLDLHRPVLARDEAVYVGEPIAAVIAESRYIAEDAAALVEIDYEPLPAVSDCRAALAPGAPRAHSQEPHNLAAEFAMGFGDTAAAFARAKHVFAETLWQHRGVAHSIECRGVVAALEPLEDFLTVWTSTQTPHACKRYLCALMGRDEDKLRVAAPDVGGGFGPKLVFYPEEAVTALAAVMCKRPVKWIEDRREHFVATTQERDQLWEMEIAVDANAHILGVRGALLHDHGAYTARGVNVPQGSASALTLPYVIPAYHLDVKLAVTNKTPVTPIRGAGQPQAVFAMERLLDRVARELGLDRAEVRRRNLVPAERMPYSTPMKTRGGMQIILDSGDYPATQAAALARAGWDAFPARKLAARAAGKYIGMGLANYVEGTGRGPFEPVRIRVAENGRVHVASGAAAMGQSTKTMLAQIVAEQLGGDMANIVVSAGDTAAIELGMGGFNSRQAVMAGSSAHAAAVKLRDKIIHVASHIMNTGAQALEISGREVRMKGGGAGLPLGGIAAAVAGLPGYYIPGGVEPGLEATERVIINEMTYANGSCVAEVEVDIETGMIRARRVIFAHDCGRVIHPGVVEGQIIGGAAHGLGNALMEFMAYDENAQPQSTTLADYLLMGAADMPTRLEIVHMESPSPLNALGVKGVGESGVIPITAAIASAVDDALSDFSARVSHVPLTPEDVVAIITRGARAAFLGTAGAALR